MWILPMELGIRSLFQVAAFSRKSVVMDFLMSLKTISITIFTDCYARNFYFCQSVREFPFPGLYFPFNFLVFKPFVLYLKLSSPYNLIFSENFLWFSFISHQKFEEVLYNGYTKETLDPRFDITEVTSWQIQNSVKHTPKIYLLLGSK